MSIERQLTDRFYSLADKAQTPDQIKAVQAHIMGSIQDGALPAYAGVPLIQDLTSRLQQLQAPRLGVNVQPQAQAPQPVAQQVMQNAMGVAALPTQNQGVEALPSNITEESYAGGGIVAFNKGGQSFDEKLADLQYGSDDDSDTETSSLFRRGILRDRLRGLPSIGSFRENLAAFMPPKAAPAPTAEQTANFMGSVYPPQVPIAPVVSPAQVRPSIQAAPQVAPQAAPAAQDQAQSQAQAQAQAQISPEQAVTDRFAPYEKMFQESKEAAAKDRETDKWLRIMQAGLGVMGSTSPYALTNIGQGAMGALKDYAADVSAARKDEADRLRAMLSLGMKKEEMAQQLGLKTRELDQQLKKLGITEELYKHHGAYYDAMAKAAGIRAAGAGAGAGTKMDIAKLNAIKSTYATLQKSAGDLTSPNYGKSPEELWSMAESMVTGQSSAAPTTNTISWSSLGKK